MNRVVTTAAAAATAYAFLSVAGARHAAAQLVYEPFNYPAGAALEGRVNPINGQPWSTMGDAGDVDDIVLGGGSLAYPNFAAPTGNSVTYAGAGRSERLALERVARAGQVYYSLALRVSSLGGMTTAPTFIAGFSDRTGGSNIAPTTVGTRLYLRQGATSAPGAETFNIGVSKNSSFDITFGTTEYALNTPLLVVGSYEIVGAGAGTDDVARLYVNPTSLGSAAAPTGSTASAPIITAPVAGTDLTSGGVPSVAGFVLRQGTGVPGVQVDELRVDTAWARVTPPTGISWNTDASGAWSESAKWSTAASPNASGAFVNFNGNITAPRTITVDAPVALRTITFDSPQPYTLAAGGGGAGALNFSTSAGINVRGGGSHTIAAPITLGGEMLMSVATGSSLNLTGDFTGGAHGVIKAGDGAVRMRHLRGGSAEIVGGAVSIAPGGAATGTSRVAALAVAPDASLDLADNDLVVDYTGASPIGAPSGGVYSGLSGLLVAGRNDLAWNGPGIRTSEPLAQSDLTTLAIAEASDALGLGAGQTATWSGQVVDDTSVLVMYTYGGDTNLDGKIDADDYGTIDFSVLVPGSSGYYAGDFNWDGVINADDYGVIDYNILAQGEPLGQPASFAAAAAAAPAGVTSVPEPSAALAAVATVASLLARRPRRRRRR